MTISYDFDMDGLIAETRERFEHEPDAENKQAYGQMLVALGFLLWRQQFVQELECQGVAPEMAEATLEEAEHDEQHCPFPLHLVPKMKALLTRVLGVSFDSSEAR